MKGIGTDETAIIKIVANRTNKYRQELKTVYKSRHGRDLVADLKSETGGKFEDILVGLFQTPVEYDCACLNRAMKGLGSKLTKNKFLEYSFNWYILRYRRRNFDRDYCCC